MMERQDHSIGKISVLELVLIIFISLMCLFVGYKGIEWMNANTAHGNDSMLANTAESEAKINSNNGLECVVQDCPSKSGGICPHQIGTDGTTLGYLDKETKHIVADRPYGYNEYTEMDIQDESYYGDRNTMVIQVTAHQGEISVCWVPGRSRS
jgi:hypothetical protein